MWYPRTTVSYLALVSLYICLASTNCHGLPKEFVYVEDVIPNLVVELRYCGANNFVGCPIDGYVKPRCILTKEGAQALKKVQDDLNRFGLGLKIYDAYRPQRAVSHFVRWARDLDDTKMKSEYYPEVDKANLFKDGYIAARSGHSRGSAVDLTIVSLQEPIVGTELDMGTPYDFFDLRSWPDNPGIGATQRAHRLLLQLLMKTHGFESYRSEWWHFILRKEPFPDTYFDFSVE